tara:strand:- start:2399 stop:2527 length:129 start_codon:yes stop_codon:yes gene_type:complete
MRPVTFENMTFVLRESSRRENTLLDLDPGRTGGRGKFDGGTC